MDKARCQRQRENLELDTRKGHVVENPRKYVMHRLAPFTKYAALRRSNAASVTSV